MTERTQFTDTNTSDQEPSFEDDERYETDTDDIEQEPKSYRVEMLAGDEVERIPVSASEALVLDPAARAKQFAADYVDGTIPVEILTDAWSGASGLGNKPAFVVFHPVSESEVDAMGVPRELFVDNKFQYPGADERQKLVDAGDEAGLADFDKRQAFAAELDALVTPQQRQEEVEAYYGKQTAKVERLYTNDLDGVERKETGLETLHQAFDLTDSVEGETVGGIRVLNFTKRRIEKAHIEDLAEELGYFSDRSGGAIFDNFDNVVYIPSDHPSLKVMAKQADGTMKEMTRRGYMAPRTLVLSELVLLPPEEQPDPSAESTAFFHSFARPDEPTEGPDAPVRTVAQGRHRGTTAHEMTHMALFRKDISIPMARSLYSRTNPDEHDAELGAAQFLGEDHLVPVEPHELVNFEAKWKWLRDKGARDGRPQGEHSVVANEHDLTNGPLPRRTKRPGQPLPTEVRYKLATAA